MTRPNPGNPDNATPDTDAPRQGEPLDLAQKRAMAADIARRIAAVKQVQQTSAGTANREQPVFATSLEPAAPQASAPRVAPRRDLYADPADAPGYVVPRPHPLVHAQSLNRPAPRRQVGDLVADEPAPPQARAAEPPQAEPTPPAPSDSEHRAFERLDFSMLPAVIEDRGLIPDRSADEWDPQPDSPDPMPEAMPEPLPVQTHRRPYRAARLISLAAIIGAAAGAAMLWQFGLGDNARQIVVTTADQIAPGDSPQNPPLASPVATVDAQPAAAPAPEMASAPEPMAAPEPAPAVAPQIAATPAPAAAPELASTPEPAEPTAAAPTTSPEPAPAFVAEPFDPHVLTPPANALPPMPSAASIAAAPISIPPTPTDLPAASRPLWSAAPQSFSTGTPFATATSLTNAQPAPRIIAQLKPAAKPAAAQPGAKPFVPTAKATKPEPVAKPAATKPTSKPSDPFDSLIEFLSPNGGKAPTTPTGNKK